MKKISQKELSSVTYAMQKGIAFLENLLQETKDEMIDPSDSEKRILKHFKKGIEDSEQMLNFINNLMYGEGEVFYTTNCEECDNTGFIYSNDENGNDDVQKCDECDVFVSDDDAKNFEKNRV